MKSMRPTFGSRWRVAGFLFVALLALAGLGLRTTSANDDGAVAFRRENLVRLHIIANSDSPADQRVKLLVRDDLLRDAHGLFRGVEEAGRAREVVRRNLPHFQRIAERRLRAEGFVYPVRVSYGVFPFPERTYGRLTLPAGRYTALRIVLGQGAGRNWWCVLFPPLCFLEMDTELTRGRVKVTRGAGPRVAVRVKLAPVGATHPVPLSVLSSPLWK